jgi:hypothetical protein
MFEALGAIVAGYAVYAVFRGEVYARHRAWGRSIRGSESPKDFWIVIGIYAGLAAALLTVF